MRIWKLTTFALFTSHIIHLPAQSVIRCDTINVYSYGEYCEQMLISCISLKTSDYKKLSYSHIRNLPLIGCDGCEDVKYNTACFKMAYSKELSCFLSYKDFNF